jgi:hypothetical protein
MSLSPLLVSSQATYRFWLFNDCIVFATESGTSSAGQALRFLNVTSAGSNKLKFAGRFSLQGLRMEDMEDTPTLYNAFQIIPSSTSPAASLVPTISGRDEPRYTLILPTFSDKKDWLTELQNAIDRISKYKGTCVCACVRVCVCVRTCVRVRVLQSSWCDLWALNAPLVRSVWRPAGQADEEQPARKGPHRALHRRRVHRVPLHQVYAERHYTHAHARVQILTRSSLCLQR